MLRFLITLALVLALCPGLARAHKGVPRSELCETRALSPTIRRVLGDLEATNRLLEGPEADRALSEASLVVAWLEEISLHINTGELERTLRNLTKFFMNQRPPFSEVESISSRIYSLLSKTYTINRKTKVDLSLLNQMSELLPRSWAALKFALVFDELPSSWRGKLIEYWLSPKWTQASRLPGLRLASEEERNKHLQYAGHCANLDEGHRTGTRLRLEGKSLASALVFIGPHLVGALKFKGNKSMLALNDFRDSSGRLVITRGMVYQVREDLVDRMLGQSGLSDFYFPENVDFPVFPLISLFSQRTEIPGDYQREVDELAQQLLSRDFPKIKITD